MKRNLLLPLLLLLSLIVGAQSTIDISGNLTDVANQGIPFANVILMKATDSTLVKGVLTDDNEAYIMQDIPFDRYYVKASFMGYQTATSVKFSLTDHYTVPQLLSTERGSEERRRVN
ncbi:MAG: carboxypeptidase-like regulatory domain-containing protein [Bacteroidetes bacterium]|nr:carboxypeptidase-like regulatory domain-containing protein [Bacteroidota bacterium]